MAENKLISIIIPCYNEEKNINRTFDELLRLAEKENYKVEIIAVNDGSSDETWKVISEYARKYEAVKGVNLMGNYGQSAAYQAGFDESKGDYVVLVSADLEIPIENVKKVIEYMDEGYDFVNTNRVGRWSEAKRKIGSGGANRLVSAIAKIDIKDLGSGMKGLKKVLVENIRLYGEMHRFIPAFARLHRAKMIEFDVEFKDRDFGVSAYKGHKRAVKVALDLITLAFFLNFARKPFRALPGRLFGFTGAVISGIGTLFALYLFVLKVLGYSIGGRPLLTLSVLMIIVGVQSMMMGMIGELLMRTYFESSGRRTYTVRERV
ncbi:glycosyltransferase family 2 protein [Patescibacteria group bacterium]|nr:glycosyltransferase family 2 protein [Patescibacteria group bacterium]